jgi:hypothetical protein
MCFEDTDFSILSAWGENFEFWQELDSREIF